MSRGDEQKGSEGPGNAPVHVNPMLGMARQYDTLVAMMMAGRQKGVRKATIELAGIRPGDRVLEVGCGTGTLTLLAKRKAGGTGTVVGIDPMPEMLEIATRKALKAKLDVAFQAGELEHIPFPDSSFDVVLASFMIFHTDDATRPDGLKEVLRVVKPGGRFLIIDTQAPRKQKVTLADKLSMHLAGPGLFERPLDSLEPALKAAGFRSVQCGETRYAIVGYALSTK